jgi:hypothetical protein
LRKLIEVRNRNRKEKEAKKKKKKHQPKRSQDNGFSLLIVKIISDNFES